MLTFEVDMFRAVAIVSRAGKYMLDDNGEKKAAKEPTITIALFSFTVKTENSSCFLSPVCCGCFSIS